MIFLDIEVLKQEPEPFMLRPQEIAAPANYKDPEKIAAYIADKEAAYLQEQRDKSSLEPLLGGTVCCVAIAVDLGPAKALLAPTGDETGERVLLEQLERGLQRYPEHVMVTWGGAHYDWPFLAKRAVRHGLYSLARRCYVEKPWGNRRHVDLFRVWQGPDNRAIGRLVDVARYLGVELDPADEISGAQVTETWHGADGPQRVARHAIADVRALVEIYRRLALAGWVLEDALPATPEPPIRPPRLSEREELLSAANAKQMDLYKEQICAAATAAGSDWKPGWEKQEDGPVIDASVTTEQLRRFVAALNGGE
jgi:DNA polymerase elongation subunit (family B)